MSDSFNFQPIGFFKNKAFNNYDLPRQPENDSKLNTDSYIELIKNHQFEQALENLEGFSRIWVIFHFHKNQNWNPKILPPRGSEKKIGVFASRSPYRPNPIGLSCLELIKIEGLKVFVSNSDILNDTPILDIKPYIPYCDAFPDAKSGWLENIEDTKYEINFTPQALLQTQFLAEVSNSIDLTSFIKRSLEYEPLNSDKKRLILTDNNCILCYRTWRIKFSINSKEKIIQIEDIFSGYSETDLKDTTDIYKDKKIHLDFILRFKK